MIDTTHVRDELIKGLTEIQANSGRQVPLMTGETCPLEDLPGFDSHNALELSLLLSQSFGREIESVLFLTKHYGKRPTIDEMAGQLAEYLNMK